LLRQELAKLGEGAGRQHAQTPSQLRLGSKAAKPSYLSLKGREEMTYLRNRSNADHQNCRITARNESPQASSFLAPTPGIVPIASSVAGRSVAIARSTAS
jgi:hypothetical protein